jgi:hypothetical protein
MVSPADGQDREHAHGEAGVLYPSGKVTRRWTWAKAKQKLFLKARAAT